MPSLQYHWVRTQLSEHRFLSSLNTLFEETAPIEIFFDRDKKFGRIEADGVFCVRGKLNGEYLSVIMTDFRVSGGSFGHSNSTRIHAFLREIHEHEGSLLFVLNTLGARFTEGRHLFQPVFQIIPAIYEYAKSHPYLAIANGKALGMGALFFGQAQYRIAASNDTLINLTGPEVLSQFFGENHGFETFASAAHQVKENSLIHEVAESFEAAMLRAKAILSHPSLTAEDASKYLLISNSERPRYMKSERALAQLLNSFSTHATELFPQLSEIARVFLVQAGNETVGVILNPPLHPNNMLSVKAVEKSQAAMNLFERLRLPVLSMIDSPGGDPRPSESDEDAIMKMVKLVHTMIDYPYGKMGVVTHRCFGGACMFAFPKIFGADHNVVIKGAKIGIISESIIETLIQKTRRMREEWEETKLRQPDDLSDLIAEGSTDRIVELTELQAEVATFIDKTRFKRKPQAEQRQPILLRRPKPKALLRSFSAFQLASSAEDATVLFRRSPQKYFRFEK
jgi:acetyl-CoA carboxylase carboxyltransferase component